jgi:G3E family GTPase
MDITGLWSQAGGTANCSAAGRWFAATPADEWPDEPDIRDSVLQAWVEPWGDRRQEPVFIGCDIDKEAKIRRLESALLDETELALGPEVWATWTDELPPWVTGPDAVVNNA